MTIILFVAIILFVLTIVFAWLGWRNLFYR
jgi:hypothetical protein